MRGTGAAIGPSRRGMGPSVRKSCYFVVILSSDFIHGDVFQEKIDPVIDVG